MKAKQPFRKVCRNAKDGRFVSFVFAQNNPDTTIVHSYPCKTYENQKPVLEKAN